MYFDCLIFFYYFLLRVECILCWEGECMMYLRVECKCCGVKVKVFVIFNIVSIERGLPSEWRVYRKFNFLCI